MADVALKNFVPIILEPIMDEDVISAQELQIESLRAVIRQHQRELSDKDVVSCNTYASEVNFLISFYLSLYRLWLV